MVVSVNKFEMFFHNTEMRNMLAHTISVQNTIIFSDKFPISASVVRAAFSLTNKTQHMYMTITVMFFDIFTRVYSLALSPVSCYRQSCELLSRSLLRWRSLSRHEWQTFLRIKIRIVDILTINGHMPSCNLFKITLTPGDYNVSVYYNKIISCYWLIFNCEYRNQCNHD